jgi:hypothetical protein
MNLDVQDLDLSQLVLTKWNKTTLLDSWLPALYFCCTDHCKLSEALVFHSLRVIAIMLYGMRFLI